ncbi:relaxase/mobilization nuclease domain-containing protein [Olivibacter jilunii]|uniref:relaxase/mobilization nuclease domain-containing protein n=1 Tax=Olivibacter jilunii TaxID=985016 RepID=UPI0013EF50FD|nr:relaxase/mobilization nuclease domain-containing protein [Olivibacter jilunii]
MVAVINSGTSFRRPLNYNENKVKEGVASCIGASGYPKDVADLSFDNKLNVLVRQAAGNHRAERKAIHISLNFDPSEKGLTNEEMMIIAGDYMQGIGFGDQPYLVYRHKDAAHPHIHIVTTKIKADGLAIDTQHIGRDVSRPLSRRLEEKYGLVKAIKGESLYTLKPIDMEKVEYGKFPIRNTIQNILSHTLKNYRLGSLHELNALLGLYNVRATRGEEGSRVHKHRGLFYQVYNPETGKAIGRPIKSSRIFIDMPKRDSRFKNHPSLDYLSEKFVTGSIYKKKHKTALKNMIDLTLSGRTIGNSLQYFIDALKRQGVDTVLRRNAEGRLYGITYVDHNSKCVFNGSELGKAYGITVILNRLAANSAKVPSERHLPSAVKQHKELPDTDFPGSRTNSPDYSIIPPDISAILESLFGPEYLYEPLPYELRIGRKKRKKRRRKGYTDRP